MVRSIPALLALALVGCDVEKSEPSYGHAPGLAQRCIPDCTYGCGEDGCGGWCGDCGPGSDAGDSEGGSCAPDCSWGCGDDGCGGWCGDCTEDGVPYDDPGGELDWWWDCGPDGCACWDCG